MRSHLCGDIAESSINTTVAVCGWVRARRDHGGVIFMDLRDRSGISQLVADPAAGAELFAIAERIRAEYVVFGKGIVRARPAGSENPNMPGGGVEILLHELEILNTVDKLPFLPDDATVSEEIRLRHRVVDLRGGRMQANLRRRSAMMRAARDWLLARDFLEIETPMLSPATPEGARDFLVPSRLQAGAFYALPQSPQLFKQMLMTAGFERYFQIARCFRDEDLRADRQPEFSQIDIEMSFVDEAAVMDLMESLTFAMFLAAGIELPRPFMRMECAEAVRRFGVDRPDLRNPLELVDLQDLMLTTDFRVFRAAAEDKHGRVAALKLPGGGARLSRGEIDSLTAFVGQYGAKGLAYIKVVDMGNRGIDGFKSPILKFMEEHTIWEIIWRTSAQNGDMVFFGAGREDIVNASLAALRDKLAVDFGLLAAAEWKPLWITDFPLFELDYDNHTWSARHHPFTAPQVGDESDLLSSPGRVVARAYDMTLNGTEIGGGSIRNHTAAAQLAMLAALGIDESAARQQFGFLLAALESGTPPHGGIAFGLDRMAAMASGAASIRDVIAFPKTQRGQCPLTGAPSAVESAQLRDLHLRGV